MNQVIRSTIPPILRLIQTNLCSSLQQIKDFIRTIKDISSETVVNTHVSKLLINQLRSTLLVITDTLPVLVLLLPHKKNIITMS